MSLVVFGVLNDWAELAFTRIHGEAKNLVTCNRATAKLGEGCSASASTGSEGDEIEPLHIVLLTVAVAAFVGRRRL